jgi:hypothetical protein
LLYTDYGTFVSQLSDEQAGQVFKKILDFAENGTEEPIADPMANMAWTMIKNNLVRDMDKWQTSKAERESKGKIGGIVRALKAGQKVTQENINFLKAVGYLNEAYLTSQGVSESTIALLRMRYGLSDT